MRNELRTQYGGRGGFVGSAKGSRKELKQRAAGKGLERRAQAKGYASHHDCSPHVYRVQWVGPVLGALVWRVLQAHAVGSLPLYDYHMCPTRSFVFGADHAFMRILPPIFFS